MSPKLRLILAHGAGQGMDSDFMLAYDKALNGYGVGVTRFNFPYMQRMTKEARRLPPDRMPKLIEAFKAEVQAHENESALFIGGKSMGGRVASLICDELESVKGCICLGYPFHPPGKPEKLRTEHLLTQKKPTLILQGTRDPFGKPDEIASYELSEQVQVSYLESGEHSFKPIKSSGFTQQELIEKAAELAAEYMVNHA